MRVLGIYPGMDMRFNDNAYALTHLSQMGVKLEVITSRHAALKTEQQSSEYEDMDGVRIHRLYKDFGEQTATPLKKYDRVREIAGRLKPDLIFCSQQLNMPIAKQLKADLGVPIVLLVEFAWDPILLLGRRRSYLGIRQLAPLAGKLYWRRLCASSDAIITCNPPDRERLRELGACDKPVYFVGWCNEVPAGTDYLAKRRRESRGIYVGSLPRHSFKNSEELLSVIPLILEQTPAKEFMVIGNGELAEAIERLGHQWRGRLRHIKELTRSEVIELVAGSFFAFTPVKFGGWGFIGDSWAVRTPVVATHNGYEFVDGEDALIAGCAAEIPDVIGRLYDDEQLYTRLQAGGYRRYRKFHTARQVAEGYHHVFSNCLAASRRLC
jgi:glycosyltransferase involved in cell wall biosynthesis